MNPPKNNSNSVNSSLPTGVMTHEIIEIPNEMENRQLMKKINLEIKKKIESHGLFSRRFLLGNL